MIIETKKKKLGILSRREKHIAFAINTEGFNEHGFTGKIMKNFWPQLKSMGECKLGTCISKEIGGITYHALVCYSFRYGWQNQKEVIRNCFDSIQTDEPIATVKIGTNIFDEINGANFNEIYDGMKASKAKIILYLN